MMPVTFDYRLYGLSVRSEVALPELESRPFQDQPDVRIRLDRDQDRAAGTTFVVDGVGRYRVVEGGEIIVRPAAGAHERNLRLYLLGSAMGVLLHQRGFLPLHANAIEIDGRAVVFVGPSGSGKSTLAAWFHDCGYRIIADDVCVVRFDDQARALAEPGLPRLRLWREALERTGRDCSQFLHSYAGADDWPKFDVPLGSDRIAKTATEIAAVYLLERGDRLAVSELRGVSAAEAIFANTYRGSEVLRSGRPRAHWEACLRLIESVPLFRLRRRWDHGQMEANGNAIAEHARGTIRNGHKSLRTG